MRELWAGDIDEHEFYARMRQIIIHGYEAAWEEGQEEVGVPVFLPFYISIINQAIIRDVSYIYGFASDIISGNRESGGKLSSLMWRTNLWANGFNKIKNLAKWMIGGDEVLLTWERHSKDGCRSCVALDGRTYTAAEWREFGIKPQDPRLACMIDSGGIPVCRCTLTVTDKQRSTDPFPQEMLGVSI